MRSYLKVEAYGRLSKPIQTRNQEKTIGMENDQRAKELDRVLYRELNHGEANSSISAE